MNKTTELFCAHTALLYAVALGAGIFLIAGWLPPIHPTTTAQELQQLFVENPFKIRLGMIITGVGSAIIWPFAAAIYSQMRRMEGAPYTLAVTQLAAASGAVVAVMVPAYIWLGAAYRPELIQPATLQVLSDISWLMFIGAFGPGLVQNVAIGVCVLNNNTGVQAYPRWVGYANLWIAVTFLPGALLPFFKTGPFTWAGIIGFWLVAFAFFGWILMMWWMTVKAIKAQP